jgi:hypothetical protein
MSGGPNVAALDGQISVPWRRIAPVVAEMSPAAAVLGRETVGGVVVGGTVVELVLANSPWSRGPVVWDSTFGPQLPNRRGMMAAIGAA